jgi:hypothetical protein
LLQFFVSGMRRGLFSEIEQVVKGALLRHRHTAQLDVDGVVQLMIYRERV